MARQSRFLFLMLPLTILVAGCCSQTMQSTADAFEDLNAPVVIVKMVNGRPTVIPDPVVARDRSSLTREPVAIQWIAGASSTLQVTMKDKGQTCVTEPVCQGPRCVAYARETTERKECRYNVTLDGVTIDPVVIIQPCC